MGEHFDTLRAMPSLEHVSDDAVRWLARHVVGRSFEPGETFIVEGAEDRDCFFIVSGVTEVRAAGNLLGRTGAGEPEGEMALFFRRPRGCTTTALAKVETLVLEASVFDALRDEDPDLADDIQRGVLRHMARRFASSTDQKGP